MILFISLDNHRQNFTNNPARRFINPAKKELGRISKIILGKTKAKNLGTSSLESMEKYRYHH